VSGEGQGLAAGSGFRRWRGKGEANRGLHHYGELGVKPGTPIVCVVWRLPWGLSHGQSRRTNPIRLLVSRFGAVRGSRASVSRLQEAARHPGDGTGIADRVWPMQGVIVIDARSAKVSGDTVVG
jgi:hypothetical protein